MTETAEYIRKHYTAYDEDGRFGRSRSRLVEYLTTMRYIDKYLSDGARIIEIGAGTGAYSLALAERGYSVDAVELTPSNIEIFKGKIKDDMNVTVTEGNALDLSVFADETYDITLLFGPLYHLFTEEDKLRALSEALRVTKRGGVVFAAYCLGDAAVMQYGFGVRGRGTNIYSLLEKGLIDPETWKAFSAPELVFELVRKEDIDALMAKLDVERLHYAGVDILTYYIEEKLDAMDEETFELYLKYNYAVCERGDMVGIANHVLDVFRKR
jgi:SAM-dependent methyltransferase